MWAGDKAAAGRLKGLITSPFQQIEAKGIDPIRMNNFVRLLMTSNEQWVVPAGMDERRFAVLEVDPRCAGNHDYFREMDDELGDGGYATLLHDLLAFDLERVDLRTIPKTTALLTQKERELDPIAAWWLDRLMAGSPLRAADAWDRFVLSRALFDDFIAGTERVGVGRKAQETTFGRELKRLIPGVRRVQWTTATGRGWHYELPPLGQCRTAWDETMQQPREWPSEESNDDSSNEREESRDF